MLTNSLIVFRIKLTVAVYKDKKLIYRNDMLVPTSYQRRSECRAHIKKEIINRLRNSNFFISPRVDFDLVRYTNEATCNTYIRYRVVEDKENILINENISTSSSSIVKENKLLN